MGQHGPLAGCRVVELAGIGPGPFAGMILADLGAEVIRVDRPGGGLLFVGAERYDLLNRGKKSVLLDLKRPADLGTARDLVARADVLIEGYRPGVAERLGLGPAECLARNPALIYGRMTGWGQEGPLAGQAGHDIAYIALTGALHAFGQAGAAPQIPLNLVGDFGGGGAYLVIGILAALWAVRHGAPGQVVDAAIVDGTAHQLAMFHGLLALGAWNDERGVNLIDGGAPFYAVYATSDGRHLAVGALEAKFYAELLDRLGLDEDPARQHDRAGWPALRQRIAAEFAKRTQAEWAEIFAGSDACVAPVLSLTEAPGHPQMKARGSFVTRDGIVQPAPAPRFSATPAELSGPPPLPGEHTSEVLEAWGARPGGGPEAASDGSRDASDGDRGPAAAGLSADLRALADLIDRAGHTAPPDVIREAARRVREATAALSGEAP
jgi:alpha-methylacyl-CoA racemase